MVEQWTSIEKYIRVGFWGLNIGLLLMVLITLFPGGLLQLTDVLNNGYWHARSQAFLGGSLIRSIEWIRIVPDLIFGVAGVMPIVVAVLLTYMAILKKPIKA